MNTKDAIRASMDLSLNVIKTYVGDLTDADLLRRPTIGCNHLAWQLGHLINSESHLVNSVCPGQGAVQPEGFAQRHSKENIASDDPKQFCTKQEYLDLFDSTRAATLKALEGLPDADLDLPSPEWIRSLCPTVGHFFALVGTHPMMHAGQFVVVRRQLGKPIVI